MFVFSIIYFFKNIFLGYGYIILNIDFGKVMMIFYVIIGIFLVLMVLVEVGKKLIVGLKFLWKFVWWYYYIGYCIKV